LAPVLPKPPAKTGIHHAKKIMQQTSLSTLSLALFRRTDDGGGDPREISQRQPADSTQDRSPETVLSPKTIHFRGISASISRSEPLRQYSTD
jgi:hypothetical protein